MQTQRRASLQSRIPRRFALALRALFYTDIVVLISTVAGMSRLAILSLLPLFFIAGLALWIIAHWLRLDQRKRSIYMLDDRGVSDYSYAGGGMTVGWEEIERVEWTNWGGFRGLKIILKDHRASIARLSRFDRMTAYGNHLSYGSPLVLWQAWSDTPLEDYAAELQAYLAERSTPKEVF